MTDTLDDAAARLRQWIDDGGTIPVGWLEDVADAVEAGADALRSIVTLYQHRPSQRVGGAVAIAADALDQIGGES